MPQWNHEQRADPEIAIGLVPDSRIIVGVVTALQLAGPHTKPGQTPVQLEPGCLAADAQQRYYLVPFHSLDDGTARVGERLTPLRDYPHHGLGIESGRADRLLDLEHRLEQLGVE